MKNKLLKLIVLVIVLCNILNIYVFAQNFSDLSLEHWAYTYVARLTDLGIINGFPDGTYLPEENVTREQFAKVLVETMKLELKDNEEIINFEDVQEESWSKKYIDIASKYLVGYVEEEKNIFKPMEDAKREDMAIAVVRAKGLEKKEPNYTLLDKFSDKDEITEEGKKYIAIAVEYKIMQGKGEIFDPKATLTRAEMATLMNNVLDLVIEEPAEEPAEELAEEPAEGKININPAEEVDTEKYIRIGLYYSSNVKTKATITCKEDMKLGVIENNIFTEKHVIKSNSKLVIEQATNKYLKIYVDGKVLDGFIGKIQLIPEKNSSGEKILSLDGKEYRGCLEFENVLNSVRVINILLFQEYLYSVVPSEMPASYGLEALKAQAIAARTYALSQFNRHQDENFNICPTTHCQVYKGKSNENSLTTRAVNETKDLVIKYQGELISAYYSASMGAWTEDVENVWGKYVPYLRAVENKYEEPMTPGTVIFSKEDLEERLENKGINIGEVLKIEVTENTKTGRAYRLEIIGTNGTTSFVREGTRSFFNLKGQMYVLEYGEGIIGLIENIKNNVIEEKEVKKVVKINADTLRVREEPSIEAEIINSVKKDETYVILEKQDTWIKISKNDKQGWICLKDEENVYAEEIEETAVNKFMKVAKVTVEQLNLREKATTSSQVIRQLSKNEAYAIIEEKNNWVKIKCSTLEGWVSKEHISILKYQSKDLKDIQSKLLKEGITFNILITLYDNGHGVGMSQNGAKGMAQRGFTCTEILKFYYTGVEVEEM